jgi:hypothetical protein
MTLLLSEAALFIMERALRIVELLNEGKSPAEVARIVGCNAATVSNVRYGHCWSSVTGIEKAERPTKANLNEDQVLQIKQMVFRGNRISFVARTFNQTYQQIHQICVGKTWKHVAPELNREV